MRSKWKGPFIDSLIIRKKNTNFFKDIQNKGLALTLRSRRSTILPFFENIGLKIYNGNNYIWVSTKLHHVGHKLGDFVLTKKKCSPKKSKTNK